MGRLRLTRSHRGSPERPLPLRGKCPSAVSVCAPPTGLPHGATARDLGPGPQPRARRPRTGQ
eukprot:9471027-Alexandrium_andersonii.AAC.1